MLNLDGDGQCFTILFFWRDEDSRSYSFRYVQIFPANLHFLTMKEFASASCAWEMHKTLLQLPPYLIGM